MLENLTSILGETLQIGLQVGLDAGLAELGHVHFRGIEKRQALCLAGQFGGAQQQFLLGLLRNAELLDFVVLSQHRRLAGL